MKAPLLALLAFCIVSPAVAQLPGSLDTTFKVGSGTMDWVYSTSLFSNGKVALGGKFTTFGGVQRTRIAVLNADGSLDTSFHSEVGPDSTVWTVGVGTDQKVLLGGNFVNFGGVPASRIARVLQSGQLDTSFHVGTGANGFVRIVYPFQNGKIFVGGDFTVFNGQQVGHAVLLNPDGSMDTTYKANGKFNDRVFKVRLAPGGRLLVGGNFTMYGNTPANRLCRLNSDGSLDPTFVMGSGADFEIRGFTFQPDGKIVIGGYVLNYNGQTANRIFRVNQDGTRDNTFHVSSTQLGPIYDIAGQPNGRVLVCGSFLQYDNKPYPYLVRLNPDGKVDTSYKVGLGANAGVEYITIAPDGKAIICGNFTTYNNLNWKRIARIHGDSVLPPPPFNLIRGKVFVNKNNDCLQDANERNQLFRIVKAEPGPHWGNTLNTGSYEIQVDTGTYQVTQMLTPMEQMWESQYCPPLNAPQSVSFGSALNDTISGADFVNNIISCGILKADVSSNRRRRCFRNQTYVTVSNMGTETVYEAKARVELPHYVRLLSASHTFTVLEADSVYEFALDSVLAGQTKIVQITDSVSCVTGIMGIEQCYHVTLTPQNTCIPLNPNWDGVDLTVNARCNEDTTFFTIKNKGIGSMATGQMYRIYSDTALAATDTFQLAAGDSIVFWVNTGIGQGALRLEVAQSAYHPHSTYASVTTHCNLTNGVEYDADEVGLVAATHCLPIRDSYDPNDKQVSPKGSGSGGKVLPDRYFTYTIRFQNTGNDTAYNVVVVDTLSDYLDMATFQAIASSHPYTLKLSGSGQPVLTWKFQNIMLPDSFVNSPGSNGFVRFKIRHKAGLPLGTRIENKADIYFDFNEPVRTNTTVNTLFVPATVTPGIVDTVHVVASTRFPEAPGAKPVLIYPNPSKGWVHIEAGEGASVRVLTIEGREVYSSGKTASEHHFDLSNVGKGLYLIEITSVRGRETRKLVLE